MKHKLTRETARIKVISDPDKLAWLKSEIQRAKHQEEPLQTKRPAEPAKRNEGV